MFEEKLERAMRIELTWPAWKAGALPLSYARLERLILCTMMPAPFQGLGIGT